MKDVNKKINQKSNERRKRIVLKTIVSSLAVLGSAGTIVFGTLWCHSRQSPTPEIDEIDVVLNQVNQWTYDSYHYCTIYPSQLITVQPNTRYNFTIDLEKLDKEDYENRSFFCRFIDPNEEYWDQGIVNLVNDFSFNAVDDTGKSWPMTGKLIYAPEMEGFNSIDFEDDEDVHYVLESNTIVGHLTTANFIDSIDSCYLTFSSIYW